MRIQMNASREGVKWMLFDFALKSPNNQYSTVYWHKRVMGVHIRERRYAGIKHFASGKY